VRCNAPMKIMIILVPGFSHLSLGALIEPLHTLGRIEPQLAIEMEIGAIGTDDVVSSAGLAVSCPLSFAECLKSLNGVHRPDALFLCFGLRTPYGAQADIQKLLRTAHRSGVPILGTGCAAWKMADAGLLEEGSGTVHWATLPAFAERHLDIAALDALYVTSDHLTSSPGEAAALDMMIAFVDERFGAELAEQVCSNLMISYPRRSDMTQPRNRNAHLRNAPAKLQQMVTLMGEKLENPIRVTDIAQSVGLSLRQCERLFVAHLGLPPKKYYIMQRLLHGRLLIEQTSMPILEISIASGFSSRRSFTQSYREAFGTPPAHTRRTP
jgi:transcriptional regulator GlxA family with amidase domain